jgi:hypothetical protein
LTQQFFKDATFLKVGLLLSTVKIAPIRNRQDGCQMAGDFASRDFVSAISFRVK